MSVVIAVDPQPSLFLSDMKTLQCAISPGGLLSWPLIVGIIGLLWAGLMLFGKQMFAAKAESRSHSWEADQGIEERTVSMLGEATQEIEAAQKVRVCEACMIRGQACRGQLTEPLFYNFIPSWVNDMFSARKEFCKKT